MTVLRSLVRWAYAPFVMLGLTSIAYYIVTTAESWQGYLWLAPLLVFAYACAFMAERIAPFFDNWNEHAEHGDTSTNLIHTLVYELSSINGIMMIPIITWLFPFQGLWPVTWPVWAQLIMAFLIADFAFMVIHYFSHRIPLLWRLHAVHHGVGRLYGFNGVIRHPLHQSVDMILGTMPLVIMGMPVDVAILLGFLISMTLIVQHSNVDQQLGPLDGYLAIGRAHHLHHVNWGTEGDCNFGLFLGIWDRMFGTFNAKPSRKITANDLGIDELPNFPKSYWDQLILPFVYRPGRGEPERYSKGAAKTPAQDARDQINTHGLHPAE
jgi:sterol desaturase/sphingolipid hydroxylase (fatty acid hydroxylase superfamily)